MTSKITLCAALVATSIFASCIGSRSTATVAIYNSGLELNIRVDDSVSVGDTIVISTINYSRVGVVTKIK